MSFETVASIYNTLGEVVLIRVAYGTKVPIDDEWPNITYPHTQTPSYQADLKGPFNTGVVLGGSANVCVVDIDDSKYRDPFLERNPRIAQSLQTKGRPDRLSLWVRMDGDYPKSKVRFLRKGPEKFLNEKGKEVASIEFVTQGNQAVIRGIHEKTGKPYWTNGTPPLVIRWDEIDWLENFLTRCQR